MKISILSLVSVLFFNQVWAENTKRATEAVAKHRVEKGQTASNNIVSNTRTDKEIKFAGNLEQQLEQCKSNASWNPFKREKCVWRLCKNRWGQGSCPAQGSSNNVKL